MPNDETERKTATIDSKELIAAAYRERYGWKDVHVADGVQAFDGELFVVRQKAGVGEGEVCYFANRKVRMFGSNLVEFLASRDNRGLLERISSRSVITSAVFIMLVIGIFVAGFLRDRFSHEAFNILGSVLGVAAGFFFGQSFAKDSR
jgi:hypothetical protein